MANFFKRYRPLLAVGLVAANTTMAAANQPKPADIKVSPTICTNLGSDIHRMNLLLDPDAPKGQRPPYLWFQQTAENLATNPAIGSVIEANPAIQGQIQKLEAESFRSDSIKKQAEAMRQSSALREAIGNAIWAACPDQKRDYDSWKVRAKEYAPK